MSKFFSVITPVHLWSIDRVEKFLKCAESLRNQTFKDFEWIVIDDGSTEPFLWDQIEDIATEIIHLKHEERVISYNEGFKHANGEWFALLDSDDEYDPEYLRRFNDQIQSNSAYKMFNCGAKYIHADGGSNTRDPFIPAVNEVGHKIFGGGNIVNGTYIWHNSIYKELGAFPEPKKMENIDCTEINYKTKDGSFIRDLYMGTPFDFSAFAQLEFPEIRQFFMVNHVDEPEKIIKELGNPWGQDFYLFYKYTRKYHTKSFQDYLYIVHPR